MYEISVIIPTYNRGELLINSINSVVNQTLGFENIELIIVDDASSDNTKEIVDDYLKKYDNIKYISLDKNSGAPGKPRNVGIMHATTDYIMFLDTGDKYSLELCEKLFYHKNLNPECLIICNRILSRDEKKDYEFLFSEDLDIKSYNLCSDEFVYFPFYCGIFDKDLIINNNIFFLEGILPEDDYFILNYLYHCNNVKHLNNFFGYSYIIPEVDNDSASRTIDLVRFNNYFTGIGYVNDLILSFKDSNYTSEIYIKFNRDYLTILLSYFVKLSKDVTVNQKKEALEKICSYEKGFIYKVDLIEFWARILNVMIINKKFRLAIYFANFLFILLNSDFIKRIYRNYFNKV